MSACVTTVLHRHIGQTEQTIQRLNIIDKYAREYEIKYYAG